LQQDIDAMGLLEDVFEAVKEGVIVSRTMRRHSHDVEVAEFGKSLSHLKVKTPAISNPRSFPSTGYEPRNLSS
jgi:hypothetical protein